MSRLLTLILLLNGGLVSLVVADDITPAATVVDTMVTLDAEKTPFTPPIEKDQSEEKEDKEFRDNLRKKAIKPEEKSIFWNNENNAFSLKVKTGIMNHSHTKTLIRQNGLDKNEVKMDAKATSPYVGLGLSWSIGALSFSVNGQRTDRRGIGTFEASPTTTYGDNYKDSTFWREDYDANVSWLFELDANHSLSLFGGYKSSKTHYNTKQSQSRPAVPTPTPVTGTITIPAGTTVPAGTLTGVPNQTTTTKPIEFSNMPVTPTPTPSISPKGVDTNTDEVLFDSKGPFIGLGYAYRFSKESDMRLGFNVAYGKLNGSISETTINGTQPYTSEGTQGIRYGVYLTGPISSSRTRLGELSYTLGIDAYNYTIKQSVPKDNLYYADKESVISFGGSIGYKF